MGGRYPLHPFRVVVAEKLEFYCKIQEKKSIFALQSIEKIDC